MDRRNLLKSVIVSPLLSLLGKTSPKGISRDNERNKHFGSYSDHMSYEDFIAEYPLTPDQCFKPRNFEE